MRVSEASGPGFDAIKPRIFQIGFNKCGTRSLYDFMTRNGIKSVHYKRGQLARVMAENLSEGLPPLQGIDKWVGYTDMQEVTKSSIIEACEFYRSLAAYYPRSYFILNTRSKDRWIQSRLKHGTSQNYSKRYRKGLRLGSIDETIDAWSRMWDRHHDEVPRFFGQTGQHFLSYDIEKDTPDLLSNFLAPDFETDPTLFGHEGKTDPSAGSSAPARTKPMRTKAKPETVATAVSSYHEPHNPVAEAKAAAQEENVPGAEKLSKRLLPHNDLVGFDETLIQPPYEAVSLETPTNGSTGKVIIACMKNEGPFLMEWIAYHRAIGFHHFLIYTNDCSDGTDVLLKQLDALGIVTHVNNNGWQGTSPQTAALKAALKHPVATAAEWLVHIDADEFINVRTGNGTFDCLLDALPTGTTNIAMTWRMFGSAGVQTYEDAPVLAQFDRCAPSFIPKPHTAWGFKTATRNLGAYKTISCHRPNGLLEDFVDDVAWVNGSGADITSSRSKNGWRSDTKTIGYDLVQLNHYALRSSDSFLVKRQRGRALHVDRSIGLNYWTRMDWNSYRDVTIQRNLPRMQAELDTLMADKKVAKLHSETVSWHVAKISELKEVPEFSDLMDSVKSVKLGDIARLVEVLEAGVET